MLSILYQELISIEGTRSMKLRPLQLVIMFLAALDADRWVEISNRVAVK